MDAHVWSEGDSKVQAQRRLLPHTHPLEPILVPRLRIHFAEFP
jgi:hypothetical protein